MRKLAFLQPACIILVFCVASPAQTLSTLFNFSGNDGYYAFWPLVQATNGDFYGTTRGNPDLTYGTVFKITPAGSLTTLYRFCSQTNCADGAIPQGGLMQARDGNFYGTTSAGGTNNYGTVFKITPAGALTTLHSFNLADGVDPLGQLIQTADGYLYGATQFGGSGGSSTSGGTVFKITPAGKLTTLHSFCPEGGSACPNGNMPTGGLAQATDGNLYGMTRLGEEGAGQVFKMTPGGRVTTLYSFHSPEGLLPIGQLIQAADGNLYGLTSNNTDGDVYQITLDGTGTFVAESAGFGPDAALVQGTDGNFYGTLQYGGEHTRRAGMIFRLTPQGKVTILHSFCAQPNCADGASPGGALMQATNGKFYGTTVAEGGNSEGTVFSLDVKLAPFVKTQPTSGTVGATVIILGSDLTGASAVMFNGTAAAFTVVSKSEIKTTVPAGATTGTVQVVTPTKTLNSNVAFQVTP